MATSEALKTDLGDGAWFTYVPGWLPADEAAAALVALRAECAWEHRSIFAFGKEIPQPRLTAWSGELAYRYSGQTLEPREPTPALAALTARASIEFGQHFNHVLLNLYRTGHDKIGLHADNEPELGKDPLIVSLSLGAVRRFVLVPKDPRRKKRSLRLEHGSMLVMGGTTQHRWRHQVPGTNEPVDERINVTFRTLRGPPGWRGD